MKCNSKSKQTICEDVMTRRMLDSIRMKNSILKEDINQTQPIAITDDPKFGQEVLRNQIEEFKTTVDGGTQFAPANPSNPTASPLVYYPDTDNLTFSGLIPSLNNLKWQFSLRDQDGTGLFIWPSERNDDSNSDNQGKNANYKGFRLNKENLNILNKLLGHYMNWKSQWEQSSGMLKNLTNKTE